MFITHRRSSAVLGLFPVLVADLCSWSTKVSALLQWRGCLIGFLTTGALYYTYETDR